MDAINAFNNKPKQKKRSGQTYPDKTTTGYTERNNDQLNLFIHDPYGHLFDYYRP